MPSKSIHLCFVLLLAVCGSTSNASSSSRSSEGRGITAGVSAGYLFWDNRIALIESFPAGPSYPELEPGSYSLLNHAGINFRVGYNFNKRVGLELSAGLYPQSIKFHYGTPGYQSINEKHTTGEFSGNLMLRVVEQNRLGIYLSAGYGVFGAPATGHANSPQDAVNLGAGMRITQGSFSQFKLVLRIDARIISVGLDRAFSFDDLDAINRLNILQLTAGIEVLNLPSGNPVK